MNEKGAMCKCEKGTDSPPNNYYCNLDRYLINN
jgi:hypothetical protein